MLRLPTIRDRFAEIAAAAEREQMTYLGFLSELVIAECDDRTRRRAERRIRDAGFPRPKRLEEFSFDANPAINPAVIGQLASCAWVKAGHPLCLIGDSGTGKSHLLIALGTLAAEAGYRVRYTLASKLVNELVEAADDKQLTKLINRYGRVDLILVDELGYLQLDRRGAELLFQVLTEREERSAIAIASNEPFSSLDKDIHRPAAVRRHCRPADLRRADHRNRQHLLPTRPRPQHQAGAESLHRNHRKQRFCRRGPRERPTRCIPVARLWAASPTQRFPRSAAPGALHCGCRRNADASRADPRRICPLRRARHMCRLASRPRSRRCRNLRWRRADAWHRPPRRPPEGSGRAVQVFVGSQSWSAHLSQSVDLLDTDTEANGLQSCLIPPWAPQLRHG